MGVTVRATLRQLRSLHGNCGDTAEHRGAHACKADPSDWHGALCTICRHAGFIIEWYGNVYAAFKMGQHGRARKLQILITNLYGSRSCV